MQNWPFPGYKWSGPGTVDFLVEEVEVDEDYNPIAPKVPLDLEKDFGQMLEQQDKSLTLRNLIQR